MSLAWVSFWLGIIAEKCQLVANVSWYIILSFTETAAAARNKIICRMVQKNWICLSIDNFATISGWKACDMSEVSEFSREKAPN